VKRPRTEPPGVIWGILGLHWAGIQQRMRRCSVRVSVARHVLIFGLMGGVVFTAAGCNQQPQPQAQQNNLKIVAQEQIDQNGAKVPTATGAAPATCTSSKDSSDAPPAIERW